MATGSPILKKLVYTHIFNVSSKHTRFRFAYFIFHRVESQTRSVFRWGLITGHRMTDRLHTVSPMAATDCSMSRISDGDVLALSCYYRWPLSFESRRADDSFIIIIILYRYLNCCLSICWGVRRLSRVGTCQSSGLVQGSSVSWTRSFVCGCR